jgi:hypothetical protein
MTMLAVVLASGQPVSDTVVVGITQCSDHCGLVFLGK